MNLDGPLAEATRLHGPRDPSGAGSRYSGRHKRHVGGFTRARGGPVPGGVRRRPRGNGQGEPPLTWSP
ncbi:hypothetical protein HNR06_005431 [Nocardiopsis arvandica]|uniref:Uncharacterized protein n=1 Tax=Nocardiopsis sinuspersici TaxID=501010 RepID=A0A7Y9XJE2_9ACTN|nr:hypothetical protein [Nocardiopsis sinuspersici]